MTICPIAETASGASQSGVVCRCATIGDFHDLRALERAAFTVIGARFYPLEDIEVALSTFEGLTKALIEEGHYFVVVGTDGLLIASGGWSRAAPDYGTHGPTLRVPSSEAIVRCVYVHPNCERRGYARTIMRRIEDDALSQNVSRLSLTSSRTALSLYRSMGYAEGLNHKVLLRNGRAIELHDMRKVLRASKTSQLCKRSRQDEE